MRTLALTFKFIGYLVLIAVCSPILWWLGRSGDSFEGEVFSDYDDDDEGEDVDDR